MKDANPLSMNDATPLLVVETEGKCSLKSRGTREPTLATAAVALLVAAGAVAGTRSQGASRQRRKESLACCVICLYIDCV